MKHLPATPVTHPIQPYAVALDHEHEDALDGHGRKPLTNLLAAHVSSTALAKVVATRSAAPSQPFGAPLHKTETHHSEPATLS